MLENKTALTLRGVTSQDKKQNQENKIIFHAAYNVICLKDHLFLISAGV
jgi:hypothetical protein